MAILLTLTKLLLGPSGFIKLPNFPLEPIVFLPQSFVFLLQDFDLPLKTLYLLLVVPTCPRVLFTVYIELSKDCQGYKIKSKICLRDSYFDGLFDLEAYLFVFCSLKALKIARLLAWLQPY